MPALPLLRAAIDSEFEAAIRLAIAGLIGLGVGLEREWSGHTVGPDARFAGLRTFLLLGLLGGGAGLLAAQGYAALAVALASGGVALSVVAYVMATRRAGAGADGTTEAAALTVIMLAAVAGSGWLTLAAGAGSVVVLALSEKHRLHALVSHVGETELHAALQFAVLAVVVLPLLPEGPVLGVLAIHPRTLWTVVLFFSALNFTGYIARRAVGAQRGFGITGALGGIISSTAVTLNYSRQSRRDVALGIPLTRGVIAACTVLVPRVLVMTAFLNPPVALSLWPLLLPPFVVGTLIVLLAWRHDPNPAGPAPEETRNPLRLANALQMAVGFQLAMTAITMVRERLGTTGLYGTAAVLGLTNVDALTVSISAPSSFIDPAVAARALAIGVLANTLLKLTLAVTVGRAKFRRNSAAGLLGLAAASAVALVFL